MVDAGKDPKAKDKGKKPIEKTKAQVKHGIEAMTT